MIPGSANALLLASAGAGGYSISRSLRFNSADSAYLSRTPTSAGNRKTWTWAGWVKRNKLGTTQALLAGAIAQNYFLIYFQPGDTLQIENYNNGLFVSSAVYRDVSAWMHFVVSIDTTAATSSNRFRLYANGILQTASTYTSPTQNTDLFINQTVEHKIGAFGYSGFNHYCDIMLADVHFIDGQALDPTSFGEFSATTGVWNPKKYSGPTPTGNSFWLPFSDNSAATATTLGKDGFLLGNNFTPNNLSVTAGAGNDSLVDSPTNGTASSGGDAGGVVVGNYATLNPLLGGGTLSNGNLDISASDDTYRPSTVGVSSGKWYAEMLLNSGSSGGLGIYGQSAINGGVNATPSRGYFLNGQKYSNGSLSNYGNSYTSGDIVGIALDVDAGKVWFSKNGTWQASGDPAAGTNAAFTDIAGQTWFVTPQGASYSASLNFGARPFAFAAPAGFRSLNTANLPTPTILKGSSVMNAITYTGNSTNNRAITGVGSSCDLVWIKNRTSGLAWNVLFDSVRGAGNQLSSNQTDAELGSASNVAGKVSSFDSDGFTLQSGGGASPYLSVNETGSSYAAWCWDAGTSNANYFEGTITSLARVNASAGFSIVTYTGTRTSAGNDSIGHGLGVAPSLVITKSRSNSSRWVVQHSSLGADNYLELNTTAAAANSVSVGAGSLPKPTSSVFYASWLQGLNINTETYVAYCFAPVAGYSAFGSYTGNGSATDGLFVYTGFKSRWLLVKASSSAGSHWMVFDTARDTYNQTVYQLYANLSNAEGTGSSVDFLCNGFKPRADSFSNINGSGITYIWAAFAESPFSLARAR